MYEIPDTEREAVAAQQVMLMTGGRSDDNGCYVLLTDFWRSEADMCPNEATHRVCVMDYRCGMATGGVFWPATTETRVCGEHEALARQAPGFEWSHEMARVVSVVDEHAGTLPAAPDETERPS